MNYRKRFITQPNTYDSSSDILLCGLCLQNNCKISSPYNSVGIEISLNTQNYNFVVYEYEYWALILSEEHRLRV